MHASQQCLSICPSNSCHMIACAAYIIAKIWKAIKNVKASPAWELLWQTLTSQWFLFYSQCNKVEWAKPYAVSHWCASFQANLFLGNRCSSGLLGASDGPIHKQPTVKEWPFIVLLGYWSAPHWALPPSYCQEGSIGEVIKEGWRGGHQLESERRGRFRHSFGGPRDQSALGKWVTWRSKVIDWEEIL